MKNYETDETFLGRWVDGTLSDEERNAFEKSESYKLFDRIDKESQLLDGPDIDVDAAFQKVKARLEEKKQKSKVIPLRRWYAIAATVILVIGLGGFLLSSKSYTTTIGEKKTITLADGSRVDLNANSTLSHKRFFWDSNKEVYLSGEGYFKVAKGGSFKVRTSQGTIAVLGTEFTIKDRSIFEVKCYEGRIQFTGKDSDQTPKILTQGMGIVIKANTLYEDTFNDPEPSWKSGVSEFKEQPISVVLEELMNYYPVTFDDTHVDVSRLYTGSFGHNDLDTALQATLVPMGITYKKSDIEDNTILLSE